MAGNDGLKKNIDKVNGKMYKNNKCRELFTDNQQPIASKKEIINLIRLLDGLRRKLIKIIR